MQSYDFDKTVERRGTSCVKYDALGKYFGDEDLIPLWVADMDFETPPFIMDALRSRLDHPVLGYGIVPQSYWDSVLDWVRTHHGWEVEQEWIRYIPGIVRGIGLVVEGLLRPGAKVVIQPPVYHPFRLVPSGLGREIVYNPLVEDPERGYRMDLEGLAKIVQDPDVALLILSNPHNPAGVVWDRETLAAVAKICSRNGVLVVSDEIHCDMALFGAVHVPFASVSGEAAGCSITFQAPSKTFNMAGVVSSYCIVPDPVIRGKFFRFLEASEMDAPSIFAPIATEAAFRHGEPWRRQLVSYLEDNVRLVEDFCRDNLPGVKPLRPQASFLVWLDCRGLGLSQEELVDLFVRKAGLALNDGSIFGKEGEGFMRLNIGCPRAVLGQALGRLRTALGG